MLYLLFLIWINVIFVFLFCKNYIFPFGYMQRSTLQMGTTEVAVAVLWKLQALE